MERILKYISGLLLLVLFSNSLFAQEQGSRIRGPRIGYDLAGLGLLYFEPERMIHTISVDYEAWQDIYPVVEFGFQNVLIEYDNYSYSSSDGIFGRVGVDVNILKYEKTNVYEMMYAGFRYGVSYMTHKADNISIPDDYFTGLSGGSIPDKQVNAHWISFVGGLKVEVFRNFFMGWSAMANFKLIQINEEIMYPYNIPGFGKGDKKSNMVLSYTLSYRIPVQEYKPRKIIKKKIRPEEE
jgi:hypothetical protein